jgi:DNA-binding response OmpR family regulator
MAQSPSMVVGDLEIRPNEYVAYAGGRPLRLTVRELDLLTALAERRDRIVSREELYRVVWEEQYRKSDRSVDVYIARLRQKLGEAIPEREYIHTHFGFGYRLSSGGQA